MSVSEQDFEKSILELERSRLFELFKTSGILYVSEFSKARYAAKQYAGYGLKLSGGSIGGLIDGNGDVVKLIQRIGQNKFEKYFLNPDVFDVEILEECDITFEQLHQLREFVDKVYIQAEFEQTGAEPSSPAQQVFSLVAGFEVEDGRPVLVFFNREIWKGQYNIDKDKLGRYLKGIPAKEARQIEKFVGKLKFLEKRKTTLYRVLEILMEVQAAYFVSGNPSARVPFTQRALAKQVGVDASVLNRLVSNKSIQLPWGTEAAMITLLPSAKEISSLKLQELIEKYPSFTDERLRQEMQFRYDVVLSRRSIAQYRKELKV